MGTNTAEDIKAFASQCVLMRSIYMHQKILFELSTKTEKEIMDRTARFFFQDVNLVFRHFLILQVRKITESSNHDNLTIHFLLGCYDFTAEPQKLKTLQDLNDKMQKFSDKLKPARNKIVSHLDRGTILDGSPLGKVDEGEWTQFWLDLDEFVCALYEKSFGHTMHINEVVGWPDAALLLKALSRS